MKPIIAFLLHHTNRACKWPEFYRIKDQILEKYGVVVDYDLQHFEGKKCWSCNGTGIYDKYYSGMWHKEYCWHCTSGWYKQEMWVVLEKIKFEKYFFHRPYKKVYGSTPPFQANKSNMIEGYIDHTSTRYSYLAVLALFLLYDRALMRRYFRDMGIGWRSYWWYPMNWLYVVAHFAYHKKNAYPIRWWLEKFKKQIPVKEEEFTELPF